ncbi:DNA topoisomerase IB [Sinomonas sp. JGH33]|uniref:DNA topoisomerase n=1 Tax=Sinomonas terricola TaxID=3110330 RepID=A0ABU5TAE4_9MICC|nr:DNA topoisomerase IB [Sinomonas sp. JGH33]MEA5456431.1 DNA topoisomerase IB [Sinomonas sp. JGH33]
MARPRRSRVHPSLRAAWTRRRAGRGFAYADESGSPVRAAGDLERIRSLAIPPAWQHVRIAASPRARLQASGIDAAGRTQYLYNAAWRSRQEARKFTRALELAHRLPQMRRAVTRDLRGRRGARNQALAAAVRLVDRTGIRVGGRRYARTNGTFGVITVQRRHVTLDGDRIAFKFPGKSGAVWGVDLRDADLARYLAALPDGGPRRPAIGYDDGAGFQRIGAAALNDYVRQIAGIGVSVKDLRTWRGTAAAAESLARSLSAGIPADVAWKRAVEAAAAWLNNTPAVARSSYVDPRLLDAYRHGEAATTDRAIAALLDRG